MRFVTAASAMALVIGAAASADSEFRPDWKNQALSPDARADLVLLEMTLDEKIAMVHGTFGTAVRRVNPADRRIGAGHVPGVPRLGIPDLYETDGSVGIANGGNIRAGDVATALPSSLMTAAGFDLGAAHAGGVLLGAEARAKGFNVVLSGGVNLTRDPWSGRNYEYYGEDVWLSAVMGGEAIRGVQSNGVVSTIKHFALNSQESGRYVLDARMPGAALRESDLLAFELAIERGDPGSVMCAYNKINGDWACENRFLLTDVLRRDWNFKGWVMSDWGGVHSTAKSVNSGLDQESGEELDQIVYFDKPLREALATGEVGTGRLNEMVRRILRTMFKHGLIDNPSPTTPQLIDYDAHGRVAQTIAEKGIVLLKNRRGTLPVAKTARRIVVIGGHADVGVLSGGGSSQVAAVSGLPIRMPMPDGPKNLAFLKISYHGSAPLASIKRLAPQADVIYLDGSDLEAAGEAARNADAVIVFATQWRTEALDIDTLALKDGQNELIETVARANPRTVVVLETGGAVLMPWLEKVGAVVEAWYPGERGGQAIARVLFGEVDASGRLPITFPGTDAQMPRGRIPGIDNVRKAAVREANKKARDGATTVDISGGVESFPVDYLEGADAGYRWFQANQEKPLFPFGFGLSYTHFAYSDLTITKGSIPQVTFTVRNTGKRKGSAVPQIYGGLKLDDGTFVNRLVGFQSLELSSGEKRKVSVSIEPRLLARYETVSRRWLPSDDQVRLSLGDNSRDVALSGMLDLSGVRFER